MLWTNGFINDVKNNPFPPNLIPLTPRNTSLTFLRQMQYEGCSKRKGNEILLFLQVMSDETSPLIFRYANQIRQTNYIKSIEYMQPDITTSRGSLLVKW